MRRNTLIILVTGVVLAVAAVIAFAASAAANRTHPPSTGAGASTGSRPLAGPGRGDGRITAVSAGIGLGGGVASPSAAGIATAKAVLPKLSALQLAGQRVIYSYTGLTPPAKLLSLIRHGEVAGVIFFKDNVGTTTQFKAAVAQLKQAAASPLNPVHLPLLLMTDQEGGVVRRLPGAPTLSEKQVGQAADPQAAATQAGVGAATNLTGHGLNVNLAPVLDVYRTPGNFIDEFGRSFSSDPAVAAKLGALYATGEQRHGVAATVKHFPGLGAATRSQNTDVGPVTLNLTKRQIRTVDELPYKSAVTAGVKLAMVSWAVYPALDRMYPAGLSAAIVRGELRNRLLFGGVTITDALEAGALKPFGSIANRAKLATSAGMDLLLCAASDYTEGLTATNTLRSDYLAGSPSAQASFKAAAERVLALRATLASH